MLDATGAKALGEIVTELQDRGITVLIKGVRPQHLKILRAVGTVGRLTHERHLFGTMPEAMSTRACTSVAGRRPVSRPATRPA